MLAAAPQELPLSKMEKSFTPMMKPREVFIFEATGGVHLSLVLAGNHKIDYEQAENLKTNPQKNGEVLTIVQPVIEKIASIAASYLEEFDNLEKVSQPPIWKNSIIWKKSVW
jgi:hypothetical protein